MADVDGEIPIGFCENILPGVSTKCCEALSSGLTSSSPPHDSFKGLSEEHAGGSLSTWAQAEMAFASGKRIPFDIGHFKYCKNIQNARFFLATLSTTTRGAASRLAEFGLCGPSACSPGDLQVLLSAKTARTVGSQQQGGVGVSSNKASGAMRAAMCRNALLSQGDGYDCSSLLNATNHGDIAIMSSKMVASYIVSMSLSEEEEASMEGQSGKGKGILTVVSPDTDIREMDGVGKVLQYLYALFFVLLASATWAEKVMGWKLYGNQSSPQKNTSSSSNGGNHNNNNNGKSSRGGVEPPMKEETLTMYERFLMFTSCFSVPTNFRKLRSTPVKTETDCLNGIRVLTVVWVIVGHTMLMPAAIAGYDNDDDITSKWGYRGQFALQSILGAEVGVDGFFFLSGFLAFRILPIIQPMAKKLGLMRMTILATVKRMTRLTPGLAFVMFLYYKILPHYGAGPFIVRFQKSVFRRCDPWWWTQLLYIHNFLPFDSDAVCMGWSWYLGNDMAFFLVSIPILLAYGRSRRKGWALLLGVMGLSFAVTIHIVWYFKLSIYMFDRSFDDYAYWGYSKPYTRIPAYLVGLGAGFFWHERRDTLVKIPAKVWKSLTAIAVAAMLFIVFSPAWNFDVPGSWGFWICMSYITFARPVWALANAVVTFACASGALPWTNTFLSLPLWAPLARLAYGAYLVHPVVIKFVAANVTNYYHFSPADTIYRSIVNTIVTFMCATLVYLAVERPIMTLESRLQTKRKSV